MFSVAKWIGATGAGVTVTKSVPSPRASATHPAAHLVHTAAGTPFSFTDPNWITAIATGVLAVFAIITAWYARKAFRGQSEELRTLKDQLKDQKDLNAKQTPVLELQAEELQASLAERKREAEERRRAQAARLYITMTVFPGNKAHPGNEYVAGRGARPPAVSAIVHNTGDRPVYDVRIHWVAMNAGSQAGAEQGLGTLSPQDQTEPVQLDVPDSLPAEQFIPVAYFRDAAGLRWTVTPNGTLAAADAELATGAPLIATRAAARAYPHLATPSQ